MEGGLLTAHVYRSERIPGKEKVPDAEKDTVRRRDIAYQVSHRMDEGLSGKAVL